MTATPVLHKPTTRGESDSRGLSEFGAAFPSVQMVTAAASLFTGHRVEDRSLGVTVPEGFDPRRSAADALSLRLHPEAFRVGAEQHREMVEGPRWRLLVSPGTVSVRYQDPARAERAHQRDVEHQAAASKMMAARLLAGLDPAPENAHRRVISSWSSKSRSRMAETLASLDWAPMFSDVRHADRPAMVTLTYPGEWEAVAPNSAAAFGHLKALRRRFERFYGRRLRGVWKREFQARGAPHFHLLVMVPTVTVQGQTFREWLAEAWAAVVGAERCGQAEPARDDQERIVCCEGHRHRAAGVGVDYSKGRQANNPKSIGIYFAKHSAFAAKEYQNTAPDLWVQAGSVGRFWGVWGLDKTVAGVFIHPAEALSVLRTLRRMGRANADLVDVPMWRYRTVVEPETGETRARWRQSRKRRRLYSVRDSRSGFLVVDDAPALAANLARHLDRLRRPESVCNGSGAGPVGFLP